MTIEILDLAEEDIYRGYVFYEKQESGVGDYFINTIFAEIESLHLNAGIHERHFGKYRLLSRVFPFGIFYTVPDKTVRVHAVLDLRQKPVSIASRLIQES